MNEEQFAALLAALRPADDLYDYRFFAMPVNFAFVGSATLQAVIQTPGDADVEVYFLTGNRTSALVTVLITEGWAGGRPWMNAPVNIDNLIGTAANPFPVGLAPQILPKNSVLAFELVNTSGAANPVQITLIGYKRYPKAVQ